LKRELEIKIKFLTFNLPGKEFKKELYSSVSVDNKVVLQSNYHIKEGY